MTSIKISSPKSSDFTENEIDNFTNNLRKELPADFEIEKARKEEKGYGVIWWEIIEVYLSEVPGDVRGLVVSQILTERIKIIKDSLKRKDKKKGRPNAITVYDENGDEIETRVISDSRQKPRTKEDFNKWITKRKEKKKKKKN